MRAPDVIPFPKRTLLFQDVVSATPTIAEAPVFGDSARQWQGEAVQESQECISDRRVSGTPRPQPL